LRHRGKKGDFQSSKVADLALAARSTASFPFAFEPRRVEPDQLKGNLQFHPGRPDPLLLFDGGVVDNMPVGKAARAIDGAPADGPTERVLLYLHPSPGVPDAEAAQRERAARAGLAKGARPFDVLSSATKAIRTKSLVEDLQALEAHNAKVESFLSDRDRLLARSRLGDSPIFGGAGAALARGTVAELDAERLADLLVAPWDHLEDYPHPLEPEPILLGKNGAYMSSLRAAMVPQLEAVCLPDAELLPALARHSLRPWSAVIRGISLLIEWCREVETDGTAVGTEKAKLYVRRERAYRNACELNWSTLSGFGDAGAASEVADRLVRLRQEEVLKVLTTVTAAWAEVGKIAGEIARAIRASDGGAGQGLAASELRCAMTAIDGGAAGGPGQACEVLDRLDQALLPLHRAASVGSLQHLVYLTISGSADSPWACTYPWPGWLPKRLATFTTLRRMPLAVVDGVTDLQFDHRRLDPGSKLAGNQLHNFAAFLHRRWRANDWMWGQADAASTLVDLILDPRRIAHMSQRERQKLTTVIKETCVAPLPGGTWSPGFEEEARAMWSQATEQAVEAELDGVDNASKVPKVTRSLLLWRRHAEIFAAEFSRAKADNPAGGEPCASPKEATEAWDKASRRLGDQWGRKATTALGMRATFVGWRALFVRIGFPLSLVRMLLAPVLAPAVGFFIGRCRSAFAIGVFVLGCVLPRARDHGIGRLALAGGFTLLCGLWLAFTRPTTVTAEGERKRRTNWKDPWLWATVLVVAAVVVEALAIKSDRLQSFLPQGAAPADSMLRIGSVRPYVPPVLAAWLATWVTWFWSKPIARVVVSMTEALIVGAWVWLGAHTAQLAAKQGLRALAPFGSFWWAVLAMALFSTLLGYNKDLADPGD
jgi:hypothetical protein